MFTAETQPRLDALSDLVALGTVADVVRLDKNNRILVAQGLGRIRRGLAAPGISALFTVAGRDWQKASARDIAFAVAPRINAAGRLTEMGVGIECLLTDNPDHAQLCAEKLEELKQRAARSGRHHAKTTRANTSRSLTGTAVPPSRFLTRAGIEGVVGLVASRVKEKSTVR